ncbi:hypothetical protein, partial [Snodgrassella alvi]|uniref:hypothetical protein n=1 Tax=Snodgrassella alvi TaxID=1196083 RepID=UPI001C558FBE
KKSSRNGRIVVVLKNHHYLIALIISGSRHAKMSNSRISAAVHIVLRNSLGVKLIASIRIPRNLNVNRLSLAMLFKASFE